MGMTLNARYQPENWLEDVLLEKLDEMSGG
jgi:hypothetical protein